MEEVLLIVVSVALFGTVHTGLASYAAKSLARRAIGPTAEAIYRLVFNVIAVASIAPALYLTLALPDRELYRWPQPLNYVALAVQAMAGLGVIYSLYQLDLPFFVGLRQLIEPAHSSTHYTIESTSTAQLVTGGLHRYVRHPLYSTSLVFLYLISPMTVNRLALVVSFNLYFFVGSIFEERKLVRQFGEAYQIYQRRVPRLVPRFKRSRPRLDPLDVR